MKLVGIGSLLVLLSGCASGGIDFGPSGNVNVKVGTPSVVIDMGEYNRTKFGFGIAVGAISPGSRKGDLLFPDRPRDLQGYDLVYSPRRIGFRLSYYPNNFGQDGWYFAGEGGWETRVTDARAGGSAAETFSGPVNGTYQVLLMGKQWFFESLNLALGVGVFRRAEVEHSLKSEAGNFIFFPRREEYMPMVQLELGRFF